MKGSDSVSSLSSSSFDFNEPIASSRTAGGCFASRNRLASLPCSASARTAIARTPTTGSFAAMAFRSKFIASLNESFQFVAEAGAALPGVIQFHAMVGPRRHEQLAEILARQTIGFITEHLAWRLAGAADHRQRAGQLPVPRLEGMPA